MTPSEVRGGAYYIQDFKELKGGREVTALVHVSVVRYQLSRDHLIRNNAFYRCKLYAELTTAEFIIVCSCLLQTRKAICL